MIRPAALYLLLVTAPAFAQLSLVTVQGKIETPVGQAVDFGSVAAGDPLDVVFRVKNAGSKLVYVTYLALSGADFSLVDRPLLPVSVDADGTFDFTIRFQPGQTGSYSASLQVNDIATMLLGKGVPGLTLILNQQVLAPGQVIGFGDVRTGEARTLKLTLANQTGAALLVGAIAIQGGGYKLGGSSPSGVALAAGTSTELDIVFAPSAPGAQEAVLAIGGRSYPLRGTGVAPSPAELPQPSLQLDLPTPASAVQGRLYVNLSEASQASASGTVTLEFEPAVPGVDDDPTATFSDGTRSAAFAVAEGDVAAHFGAASFIEFATGTTAGTLAFTVELGGKSAGQRVTVASSPIGIDAAVAVRNVACVPADLYCTGTNIELQINGWDNARTASQIVFRFFDTSGHLIAPGDIQVDGSQAFREYFQSSLLGGVFGLHARFPIAGDANQVTAAEATLTNSAGTTRTTRIQF